MGCQKPPLQRPLSVFQSASITQFMETPRRPQPTDTHSVAVEMGPSTDNSTNTSTTESFSQLRFKSTIERRSSSPPSSPSKVIRYCCCCPVTSGVYVLSLLLIIPSVALALSFNVATLRGFVQFNSPVQVKIVYTVIYSFYALLGLVTGIVLQRLAVDRRLKTLIVLYWILITSTIVEGAYFGIMMSKQKSKLVSYCGNGIILEGAPTIPATTIPLTGSNSTSSIEKTPHPMVCYKTHALIGAFYILGPGGWILLHSSWILVVVLYSKALRRQLPADEELAAVETSRAILVHSPKKPGLSQQISTPFVSAWKHQGLDAKDKSMMHDIELNTGAHLYQHHSIQHGAPFNESSTCNPSPGLGNMFRTMKPWASSEQEQHQSGSLQYIDGRHAQDGHNSEADDDSDDDLELSRKKSRGLGASDGSMSSRADIPADGKGWWIRQIEGKRRGEICPCTLNPIAAQEQSSCWCGQQRRTSHIRVQSTEEAGPSSTSQRPLPTQAALAPTPPLPPPQSPTVLPRHEQPTALTTSFSPWPMSRSRSQSF